MKRIKIAVSACLLGQNVRYDGGNKYIDINTYLNTEIFELLPICPEVEMGMTIPRQPIQVIQENSLQLVQVDQPKTNYTKQMQRWFQNNIQQFERYSGFVLKSKSPSCGYQTTPRHRDNQQPILADGLFVHWLRKHQSNITIIDEVDLTNPIKCAQFINNVQTNQK